MEPSLRQAVSPAAPSHAADPSAGSGQAAPRPQLVPAADPSAPSGQAAPRPDLLYEELRLARLATEVLRQLVAAQAPPVPVLARYLGIAAGDVACCAEGVQRLPAPSRRMLARVALAFAPIGLRHTARRLYEGEVARAAR